MAKTDDVGDTAPRQPDLPVAAPVNTRKHAKYPKKYVEYAAAFSTDERSIKRYVRRGKEVGVFPPLDKPEEMAGWWRRFMDHQVPDTFLAFDQVGEPAGVDATVPLPADGSSENRSPRDFSQVKILDIEANVEALRQTHAINKHLLDEALAGTNETLIQLRQKNFERSFELLRKAELALIEIQKQRGNLIDRESVRTELAYVFESLRMTRETMPRRIMAELERALPRRVQRVFRALEKYLFPAIETVRLKEEALFRNLETISGPEDIEKLMAM